MNPPSAGAKKPGRNQRRETRLKAEPLSSASTDSETSVGNTGSQIESANAKKARVGTIQIQLLAAKKGTSPASASA